MNKEKEVNEYLKKLLGFSFAGVLIYILLTSILFYSSFKEYFFYFHIGSIYPYFLIMGLLLLVFAGILLTRSIEKQYSSLYLLIVAIAVVGISYIFGFLNFDSTGTINYRQTRLFQLQVLFQTISVFLFYLHYELNSRDSPSPSFLGSVVLLLTPYSVLNIYYLLFNNYSDNTVIDQFELFSLLFLQTGTIIVFGWLLLKSIQLSKIVFRRSDNSKKLASIQLGGIFILFLGIIFQMVEAVTPLDVWHTPLNVIALFAIGFAYYKDPTILLFAPINILLFGVIDNAGRTMYFKPVDEKFQENVDYKNTSELFGGLTLAFTSLGEEVAQSQKGVDSLQFGDRSIIIESLSPYYLVVIANRSTFFLQKEMEEYLIELKTLYPHPPQDGGMIPETVFTDLNEKFFPLIIA